MSKKSIFIFLSIAFCFIFTNNAAALSYQPDLTIKYDWKYVTLGGGVVNSTGDNQMAHDFIEGYKKVSYTINIYNAGDDKDKFLLWGSAGNQYWDISYTDSVGRDITSQMTSSGWTTVTLWPKEKEKINMRIIPKKGINYGQEDTFFVMAKSLSAPSKIDKVMTHLSVRFKEETKENPPQFSNPAPEKETGLSETSTVSSSQPDLEVKTCGENNYLGKNIFEAKDKIEKQISQIITNAAYGPACFNVKLTNNSAIPDSFFVKGPTVIEGNWSIDYFSFNKENQKNNINSEIIKESFSLTLNPGESQIFEIQIQPALEAINEEIEEFLIFAQSKNDINKLDYILLSIKIDTDLDKDGMSDICEKKYNLDFRNPKDGEIDIDGDGLTNQEECFYQTDPRKKDTDNDGLWDGASCEKTILYLPGSKNEHFVIAGPVLTAKGEIAREQNISFHITGNNVDYTIIKKTDDNGFAILRIPPEYLVNFGQYFIETKGNGTVWQENTFFIAPWGKIIDKKTEIGLNGAQINLFSCQGNCCQLIAQSISDENGLWDNFMVSLGNYQLKITKPGYKNFRSQIFTLKDDTLEQTISLSPVNSLGTKILLIILGLALLAILIFSIYKIWPKVSSRGELIQSFQPDGQIKLEKEEDYLGDTIYNLSGEGQTKKQYIKSDETAIFHIRIQNDGARPDKFLIRALPVETKDWQIKFFNTLHQGNEITQEIIGNGWETGTLGSGISKDIRLEIKPIGEPLAPLSLQINFISKGNPLKIDTVKAEVKII